MFLCIWILAHCDIPSNESANKLTKHTASLIQENHTKQYENDHQEQLQTNKKRRLHKLDRCGQVALLQLCTGQAKCPYAETNELGALSS